MAALLTTVADAVSSYPPGREAEGAWPFRAPGYPVTPLLFTLAAVLLVLNTVVSDPVRGAIGLGAVVVGMPAYGARRARGRRAVGG